MRTERGRLLVFNDRPYLRQMISDDAPNQVTVACAQSGKTVAYLSKLFWRMAMQPEGLPRTAIYTFPTDTDVNEFSKARAKPMLMGSPLLAGLIANLDSAGVKQFRNGSTIYFRGTWTERAALSVPADILAHDELDRSKPDTLQLFTDRLRASDDQRRYVFGTPTIPGFGVSAAWQYSNQHEWVWICGQCGLAQIFAPMDRHCLWGEHLDLDEGVFRCRTCGAPVERQWVLEGCWEPQNPHEATAGYHVTGIMPATADAAKLASDFQQVVFPELWVQGHLGLPETSGEKALTRDMVKFGDWPNKLRSKAYTYGGLDQGKKLDLIVGDGQGHIFSVQRLDDWEQVRQAIKLLNIRMLVCDNMPDARPVQNLIAQFPGRVLMCDYSLYAIKDQTWAVKVKKEPRIRANRTGGLDETRERIAMGTEGGDVFPALPHDEETELLNQLTASVRTMEPDPHGNLRATWKEIGPDHFRHAHLYYTLAVAAATGHVQRRVRISSPVR